MSDYNSSLPIRSQADGTDERVHVKIVDGTTPAQRATVDTDGNVHIEVHGNDPATADRVLRLSELGAVTPDGVYDVTNNTKPGNVGLITSTRAASPDDTTQTQRLTSVTNSTKRLLDVSIHDENGDVFSETNPLPVIVTESEGTRVNNYKDATAVAAAGTDDHDYTVTALKTFYLTQVEASASGKAKIEIKTETAASSGIFTSWFVQFNSTASTNMSIVLKEPIAVVAGAKVRVTMTNRDNQSQDLYSTICGHEV